MPVEPFGVLGLVATKRGIEALVTGMTGKAPLGATTADLLGELLGSADRVEARLEEIARALDAILQRPYAVALAAGTRHLADAGNSAPGQKGSSFERAREKFIDASASSNDPLQRAVAERGVALASVCLGNAQLAGDSCARFESAAGDALSYAAELNELPVRREMIDTFQRSISASEKRKWFGDRGRLRDQAVDQARATIDTALRASVELLFEAAALAGRSRETQGIVRMEHVYGSGLVLLVPPDRESSIGGVSFRPERPTQSHTGTWSAAAAVRLSQYRTARSLECSFTLGEHLAAMSPPNTLEYPPSHGGFQKFAVRPGETVRTSASREAPTSNAFTQMLPVSSVLQVGNLYFGCGFPQRAISR